MAAIQHFLGELSPSLDDTLTADDGTAFDLTGATVTFSMRALGSSTPKIDHEEVDIVSAADGTVRYDWATGDVDTAGTYLAWLDVTLSAKTQSVFEFVIEIVDHAPITGDLIEIGELREFLQKPSLDHDQDVEMRRLIKRASKAIAMYCRREFAPPVTAATRRFTVDPNSLIRAGGRQVRVVNLSPHDLRSASAVSMHPETAAPTTLTADTGYILWPHNAPDGTYTEIRVSTEVAITSDVLGDFGFAYLDVTGDWGFATVPDDVRFACVSQVAVWARRHLNNVATTFLLDEGRVERPQALDSAVRDLLRPYRRAPFA